MFGAAASLTSPSLGQSGIVPPRTVQRRRAWDSLPVSPRPSHFLATYQISNFVLSCKATWVVSQGSGPPCDGPLAPFLRTCAPLLRTFALVQASLCPFLCEFLPGFCVPFPPVVVLRTGHLVSIEASFHTVAVMAHRICMVSLSSLNCVFVFVCLLLAPLLVW